MKKSKSVRLGLLAAAVGGVLSGCGGQEVLPPSTQVEQCVDEQGRVIPDEECEKRGEAARAGTGGAYTGMGPYWIYHMGMPFRMGQAVPNANLRTSPLANAPQVLRGGAVQSALGKSGTVTRGGFGSNAAGRAVHG